MDKRSAIYLIMSVIVVIPSMFLVYGTVKGFRNVNSTMDVVMIGVFTYMATLIIIALSERLLSHRKQRKAS
jgi:hypothetical protein